MGAVGIEILPLPDDLLKEEHAVEDTQHDVDDRKERHRALQCEHPQQAVLCYGQAAAEGVRRRRTRLLQRGHTSHAHDLA